MALKAIDATAGHDPAIRDGHVVPEQVVFAGQPGSILPIGHSVGVEAVAFAPDGTLIASGNVDNLVRLWQTQTGKVWRTLTGHSSGVTSVAFSPDSTLLASGSWDGTVRLWQVQTGATLRTLTGHDNLVSSVAFSPDGTFVASGSGDNTVRLWQVQTGEALRTLTAHNSGIDAIAFSAGWEDDRQRQLGQDGTVVGCPYRCRECAP